MAAESLFYGARADKYITTVIHISKYLTVFATEPQHCGPHYSPHQYLTFGMLSPIAGTCLVVGCLLVTSV